MSEKILMPEMGEGVNEGTIVKILKAVGESVSRDEPVLEIETDKVTVEVTAESDGIITAIPVQEGQTVPVGTVLVIIGQDDAPAPAPSIAPTIVPATPAPNLPHRDGSPTPKRDVDGVRVSPVVARMLQVHDVDVRELSGSGQGGRITKKDVLAYLEENGTELEAAPTSITSTPTPTAPILATSTPAPTANAGDTLVSLTPMRRSIAEHMVRSKHTSPHATTVFEFDFTRVSKHRQAQRAHFEAQNVKLTYLPYLALATVQALRAFPLVNAAWTDEGILQRGDVHLGIAVAVPAGLLVPVVRHADNYNLMGMARAINDLSARARTNQVKPDELRGGTFTITNHGVSGSLFATPIINQPQVGILGFGAIEKRVKVTEEDMLAIKPCAYVSFSFDHRVLDGASADGFVAHVKHTIETWG